MDVGRRRILELVVNYKDQGFDVLANLTKILYCKDNESIMNASGTIGTLVSSIVLLSSNFRTNPMPREYCERVCHIYGP